MPRDPRSPARRQEYVTPIWQSPLVLGIAAAVVALATAGFFLYRSVDRRNQEKAFDAAMANMGDLQYAKAIQQFDKFLEDYPASDLADKARVWRGLASVRQYADASTPTWSSAYEQIQSLFEESKGSAFFKERSKEVAEILARIAAGLAGAAKSGADPAALERSKEALSLLEKKFDAPLVLQDKVAEAKALQKEASFAIEKKSRRLLAVEAIDKALADKRPIAVFDEQYRLLQRYPDLASHPDLTSRREKARTLEKELVRFEPSQGVGPAPKVTVEPPLSLALVRQEAAKDAKPVQQTALVPVADVGYAFDAGSGDVVWRSPLGFSPAFAPIAVPGGDAIVVHDTRAGAIALLDAKTGARRWQSPLAGLELRAGSRPAFLDGRIYLVARPADRPEEGLLLSYEIADGKPVGRFVFPQPLAASPVVDASRKSVLVLGEQASLYSLLVLERRCERVIALDHGPDGVRSPPVLAGRFLFVCECLGADQTVLRCLVLSASDGRERQRQTVTLPGWVWHAPAVRGGRLFLTTDQHFFAVFEMGGEQDATPLSELARGIEAGRKRGHQDYPLATGDNDFWTVGSRLKRFEFRVRGGPTAPVWDIELGGPALSEPLVRDGLLTVTNQVPATGAVRVTTFDLDKRDPRWRGDVGQSPAGILPLKKKSQVQVVFGDDAPTVAGKDLESSTTKVLPPPRPRPGVRPVPARQLSPVGRLKESLVLWTPEGEGVVVHVPAGAEPRMTPVVSGPASAPTIAGEGVLFGGRDGLLYWIDPASGRELSEPLVGPYIEGRPQPFNAAAVVPTGDVYAAAGKFLLLLSPVKETVVHFREKARADVASPPITTIVPAGGAVLAAGGRDVAAYQAESLSPLGKLSLPHAITQPMLAAGPLGLCICGKFVVAVEPSGASLKEKWRTELSAISVAEPRVEGDRLLVAASDGTLVALAVADGSIAAQRKLGVALAKGPWPLDNRWVVAGADGSLQAIPMEDR